MKHAICLLFFLSTVVLAMLSWSPPILQSSEAQARERARMKALPFEMQQVRLLDGPFKDAMLRSQKYLLSLDADRLLHMFRVTAGLPSSAKPYGGWEGPKVELRGHSLGHYLSGCALMYASTGDERFKSKAKSIVAELDRVQKAMPSRGFHEGYLSAFPEELFDRVDAAQRVWAPYYTMHKIMAGLFDVYQHCGNKEALDIFVKLADWVKFRVDRLSDEQQQRALDTEFGGMMEVLENLYAITGDPEHLRIAREFDHRKIFDPLADGKDPLNGLHANTQIPKAIGAARDYELTGEKRYYDVARFFWQRVAHHRSYVIGGNSDGEMFFPPETFSKHLSTRSTETCNTYNMLKLTRHIFAWEPSAEAMDFYERGLYNQILASQDPSSGMVTYYIPLRPGSYKTYSTPEDSFWCCVGTGMENHAKYGDTIYFRNDTSLFVNLFIASELDWKEKGLVVRQETRFPEEDTTRLIFEAKKAVPLAVKIRYPSWAKSGVKLKINGENSAVKSIPGSYFTVERTWKNGDLVEISFPMSIQVEGMPDNSKLAAILYGPIVLAGDLGTEGLANARRYGPNAPEMAKMPAVEIPSLICDPKEISTKLKPEPGETLVFRTDGIGSPSDVVLVPFYRVFEQRYTVYWNFQSPNSKN
jgi:DUF1680 family protein